MATNTTACGICEQRHVSTPSTDWCPECEEALCSNCTEHHSLSKSSRNHKTVSIGDYRKLPQFILDINQYCEEHNEKFQLFCKSHDQPICNECISKHAKCGDITPLNKVLQEVKTQEMIRDLTESVIDLVENLTKMKKDREQNLDSVQTQKKKSIADIRKLRCELNDHLDRLEERMIKELEELCGTTNKDIQNALDTINETEREITTLQDVLKSISDHASDFQSFLGIKEIENKVFEGNKLLQSLVDGKQLHRIDVMHTLDPGITNILSNVTCFGDVQTKRSPTDLTIQRKADKQAQILIPQENLISNIKLKLNHTISGCLIPTGFCITSAGDLLFSYHYGSSLHLFDAAARQKCTIQVKDSNTFDVTCINHKTVAVTSADSDKTFVAIMDLNTNKVQKTIKLPGRPYGIACIGKSLLCCVAGKNIHIISVEDGKISTIPNSVLPSYSYIAVHGDKVFYCDPGQNTVVCCSYNGTVFWKFKNEAVLRCPSGITTDKAGNVFVAGKYTTNVVVISPDGEQHRQILSKDDGLVSPSVIFFDKSRNQLLVAIFPTTAYLFDVS